MARTWSGRLCVLVILVMLLPGTSSASPIALDSSVLTVTAGGSINTIGGPGFLDDLLDLPAGTSLSPTDGLYFTIELTAFAVTQPGPSFPEPSFYELAFGSSEQLSAARLRFDQPLRSLGAIYTASPTQNSALWELMLGFVTGSGIEQPSVSATLFWPFGGIDVSTLTTFAVTAFGEPPPTPVPEPATLLLLGPATLGLMVRGWRRTSHGRRRP